MALTAKKVYAILKRQISDMEAKLNSPVRYRGTVATADLLPLNPDIGDMYNIESKSVYGEAGMNVAWNGVVWDAMGAPIDMSLYLTKEEAEAVIQRLVTEYFEKNPVLPGATTEQVQQIKQNKKDVASLKEETGSLKEDLSNKITKFYASNQGKTHLTDSDNGKIQDMMLYGKSEQFTTTGKNLLKIIDRTQTIRGVTVTAKDGVVALKGTATETGWAILDIDSFVLDGTCILSSNISTGVRATVVNKSFKSVLEQGKSATLENAEASKVCFVVTKGKTYDISNILIQIEKGSVVTSYEPYTGGQPSPSLDYPQEIKSVVNPTVKVTNEDGLKVQSVTLNNITLNAIPVSSGGNVTINGQQYIADYVDVERGKLVRMCERVALNTKSGTPDEEYRLSIEIKHAAKNGSNKCIFSAFEWSSWETCANGIFIYLKNIKKPNNELYTVQELKELSLDFEAVYQLAEKQETDLTPEEVQAFKALATYYPVTNISVNSEQLDGYTVFNYPISMENGWNYVKKQLNDNRDYIYDMDTQSAEAYVNSEYAVALTELEV